MSTNSFSALLIFFPPVTAQCLIIAENKIKLITEKCGAVSLAETTLKGIQVTLNIKLQSYINVQPAG